MLDDIKKFTVRNKPILLGICFGATVTALAFVGVSLLDASNPANKLYPVIFRNIDTGSAYDAFVRGPQLAIMEAEKIAANVTKAL